MKKRSCADLDLRLPAMSSQRAGGVGKCWEERLNGCGMMWLLIKIYDILWIFYDTISIHIAISIYQLVWCPNQEIQGIWPYNIHIMEITAFSWHIRHQWSTIDTLTYYRLENDNYVIDSPVKITPFQNDSWYLRIFFGSNEWDKTCPCRAWKDATGSGSKKQRWSTASDSACLAERYVESSAGDSFPYLSLGF